MSLQPTNVFQRAHEAWYHDNSVIYVYNRVRNVERVDRNSEGGIMLLTQYLGSLSSPHDTS